MKLVIANQKDYLSANEMKSFIDNIKRLRSDNFILCPNLLYIRDFRNSDVLIGSQNVSKFDKGAYTGELSASNLKESNVSFCIVGHSERRQELNESINDTNIKIKKLLSNNIVPILCVGETKGERELGTTLRIVTAEIEGALDGIDATLIDKIIIAYEPIWAIGTGLVPTNEEIEKTISEIKNILNKYMDNSIVLYGGSVSLKNIDELNKIPNVDGYLIGGASTRLEEIVSIINKCK